MADTDTRPEGFQRVSAALAALAHPHPPLWLDVAARTAQEAADALGVTLGQIAKSVVFRRKEDDSAVLVITSGDKRVDEAKLRPHTGALGRADADFVKARTGFSIGGVSPAGFAPVDGAALPRLFIDRELFRFDVIWAAAGHPNGVFKLTPDELLKLTGAPVIDVVQA
jgi:prolyl-tRNA editing enzyme YbaK/EbsC (Cys-tRNA(Pro) deacylase)